MKHLGRLFTAVLAAVICLSLVACGGNPSDQPDGEDAGTTTQISGNKLTEENVAGTGWQCTYTENGDTVYRRFLLSADGTYEAIIAINQLFSHKETGTYGVKGEKLYLYLNGTENDSTVYEFKNGNLFNSGNEFTPYVE